MKWIKHVHDGLGWSQITEQEGSENLALKPMMKRKATGDGDYRMGKRWRCIVKDRELRV